MTPKLFLPLAFLLATGAGAETPRERALQREDSTIGVRHDAYCTHGLTRVRGRPGLTYLLADCDTSKLTVKQGEAIYAERYTSWNLVHREEIDHNRIDYADPATAAIWPNCPSVRAAQTPTRTH
jgi:hypothetical protein